MSCTQSRGRHAAAQGICDPGPTGPGSARDPGLVKTGIRANYLGEGSVTHKLVEAAIGVLAQSPETHANRVVPILFAPELEGRTGLMFGSKAGLELLRGGDRPILPTQVLDRAYIDRYLSVSEALLRRALSSSQADAIDREANQPPRLR